MDAKDHRAWFGLCESRLRLLIAGFESVRHGTFAYPYAKFFTRQVQHNSEINGLGTKTKLVTSFFIALRFSPSVDSVDLRSCMDEFVHIVNSWEDRKSTMDLTIKHMLQKDLPDYVYQDDNLIDLETLEFSSSSLGKRRADTSFCVNDLDTVMESPMKKANICIPQ